MAKIHVVDDEPGMRQVVLNILKPEGHQLSSAEDGAQALERVKSERPNLVMLDMRLPDMDGLEILVEIKKMLPETSVIMLSGFGDVESAVGAMKQGAFDYISKPFKVDELLNLVRKALGTQTLSKGGMIRKDDETGAAGQASVPAGSSVKKGGSRKFIVIGLISALVIGGGAFGILKILSSAAQDATYTVPYSNPTSIAFDGKTMWVTDWVTQSFYQHNLDKMFSMAQTYYIQDSHPTGITFDGKYLWSSNAWESTIYKHTLDKTLTVVESYTTPGPEPSGLYWDGIYMWICDMGQGKIYQTKITEEGLSTVEVYDSPGNNPIGLFYDGENYWVGDAGTNRLYKMNKNFSVLGIFVVPQFEQKDMRLSALGWDGKNVWTCSDESQTIYRNSFKSLKKINY